MTLLLHVAHRLWQANIALDCAGFLLYFAAGRNNISA